MEYFCLIVEMKFLFNNYWNVYKYFGLYDVVKIFFFLVDFFNLWLLLDVLFCDVFFFSLSKVDWC